MLWDCLRASASRVPGRVACESAEGTLTYGGLLEAAQTAARELAAPPGTRVGVAIAADISLATAAWAVWASGAVYVPLSLTDPVARTARRLRAAGIGTVITDDQSVAVVARACQEAGLPYRVERGRRGPLSWVRVAGGSAARLPASCSAVFPTSGSTGEPKNVAVRGDALAGIAQWGRQAASVRPENRLAQCYPPTFDAFLQVALTAWLSGACLVFPVPGWNITPRRMAQWVAGSAITHLDITPSMLRQLLQGCNTSLPPLPRLEVLVLGGEALPAQLAARARDLSARLEIFNMYGPTEATVTALAHRVPPGAPGGTATVPIGRAVPGITAELAPHPAGGYELVLSGPGVALGYLKDAGRLAPFLGGRYRTGDLVEPDDAGNLVFVGRADRQLSVRGHRVEPAEVECAALAVPGVRDAVAFLRREASGDRLALAYESATDSPLPESVLRDGLRRALPREWQPKYLLRCDNIPLTPSGKHDENRLNALLGASASPPESSERKELWISSRCSATSGSGSRASTSGQPHRGRIGSCAHCSPASCSWCFRGRI